MRLSIGHTYITRSYILKNEKSKHGTKSGKIYDKTYTDRMLISKYFPENKYYRATRLKEFINNLKPSSILQFLEKVKLWKDIILKSVYE